MKIFKKTIFIIGVFGLIFANQAWAGEGVQEDLDMVNVRQPLENLMTGGQPSEGDLRSLAEEGYELVINLRVPGEFDDFSEAEVVEGLGMRYLNIPVKGMQDLTLENARLLHDALEAAGGPVVLHCASGRRAGGLLGVEGYLFQDLSEQEAIELGVRANLDHVAAAIKASIENLKKE